MRTYKEAEKAGKDCGFELLLSYDVATASPVCGPWWVSLPLNTCSQALYAHVGVHRTPQQLLHEH